MPQKTDAELTTERGTTYPVGVKNGVTAANQESFHQNIIDSKLNKQDASITKTFKTAGTGTAYTVTDTDVTANSFLDGKVFFVIFNVDSTGSATIQFNALAALTLKIVGSAGKINLGANTIKANVPYLISKEVGVNEVYIREDASQKALVPVVATGSFGAFTATIPFITTLADMQNYFFVIKFNNSVVSGDTLNVNSLGVVTINIPANHLSTDANYFYLMAYDGVNFLIRTDFDNDDIDTELIKGFYDGATEEARIELRTSALIGLNFMASGRNFHFAYDNPTATPTNYIKLIPPNATDQTGGLEVVSTHSGTTPERIEFPATDNDTYPKNSMVVNDGFENEFPPFKHQTLTDGATVNFDLYNGFIGLLDSGAATARTINFRSTGSGGTGRVKKAYGYIYLDTTATIDVSFELDGSDLRVMTIGGTHPLSIAGTATNWAIIPYRFNYDFGGSRLFIGDPEIYDSI